MTGEIEGKNELIARLGDKSKHKPKRIVGEHRIRCADGREISVKLTPKLAIACLCTECMGFENPKNCTAIKCPLYPFRKKTMKNSKGNLDVKKG